MFEKTSLLYICTTLEAIEKIEIYSGSFQNGQELREANDQMNFNAISRLLLAIGEETKKNRRALAKSSASDQLDFYCWPKKQNGSRLQRDRR